MEIRKFRIGDKVKILSKSAGRSIHKSAEDYNVKDIHKIEMIWESGTYVIMGDFYEEKDLILAEQIQLNLFSEKDTS